MQFKTYYLAFNSPLHLGNHRPDTYESSEDYLRSDTITAAIYATWAKMGRTELIPNDGVPLFTVSSAFPYIEKDGIKSHFFPRPKLRFNQIEEDDTTRKAIKKVSWLDQGYFEKVINHESLDFGSGNMNLKGGYLCQKVDPSDHISKSVSQRVRISRDVDGHKDSDPFYMERIFFKDAGLYFMIESDHPEVTDALNFLQYEGFGTDRTVGNGFFDLTDGMIDLRVPDESSFVSNLSLYTPDSVDRFISDTGHGEAAFDTVKRGGWITTEGLIGKEKKSVRMFVEGGVWNHKDHIAGKPNINLKPSTIESHPIWRSGRSLFVPIKSK